MTYVFDLAPHIVQDLETKVAAGKPDISTERGELYIHDRLQMGAIVLRVSASDYIAFLENIDSAFRPSPSMIMPQKDTGFDIYVNGAIVLQGNKTIVNGREVVLL